MKGSHFQTLLWIVVALFAVVSTAQAQSGSSPISTPPGRAEAVEGEDARADAPTLVILVRHAEPGNDDPRNPGLSEAGRRRAATLLSALRDANLAAVYTSQFRRTRETGKPLAEQLDVPLHVVEVESPDLAQYNRTLLEHIRRTYPGRTVLVIGHSNTVPAFVEQVTGRSVPPIGETEFDRLYVVTPSGDEGGAILARY